MRTLAPRSASTKAIASPISPAPTTTTSPSEVFTLHAGIDGTFTALRRHPRDDLIRFGDVASLAVDAVREVDLQAPLELPVDRFEHRLVDGRRAEVSARISVLDGAAVATDVRVRNDQMARLILFVHRAAVVHVGQLIEGQHVIDLRARRLLGSPSRLLHPRGAGFARQLIDEAESGAAGDRGEAGVDQSRQQPVMESLVEVPRGA